MVETGLLTGTAIALDEISLHQEQLERNFEASNAAILGGVILGMGLGAMIKSVPKTMVKDLEHDMRLALENKPVRYTVADDGTVKVDDNSKHEFDSLDCP